jgi:hypothetical protein
MNSGFAPKAGALPLEQLFQSSFCEVFFQQAYPKLFALGWLQTSMVLTLPPEYLRLEARVTISQLPKILNTCQGPFN